MLTLTVQVQNVKKKFLRAIKSHTEIERGEIGLENWLIESGRFRATHSTGDDSAVLNDENNIKKICCTCKVRFGIRLYVCKRAN